LTEPEFERCFASHEPELAIEREDAVLVVSQRDGGVCPNWQDGGCVVYEDRPRECRLFPFTMYPTSNSGQLVSLRLHSETRCPLKRQLLGDREGAQQLAQEFADEAYGDSRVVSVRHESPFERVLRWSRQLVHAVHATVRKKGA
jgi:Fe-S-cluster containining protein